MILDGDVKLPLFPSCEEQASQLAIVSKKMSMLSRYPCTRITTLLLQGLVLLVLTLG